MAILHVVIFDTAVVLFSILGVPTDIYLYRHGSAGVAYPVTSTGVATSVAYTYCTLLVPTQ